MIGVTGSGLRIGVTITNAYPIVSANQVAWFRGTDLSTPLSDSRYSFSDHMKSLYINSVTYEDEGDYVIMIYHVTGNQSVTINVNVQGKLH